MFPSPLDLSSDYKGIHEMAPIKHLIIPWVGVLGRSCAVPAKESDGQSDADRCGRLTAPNTHGAVPSAHLSPADQTHPVAAPSPGAPGAPGAPGGGRLAGGGRGRGSIPWQSKARAPPSQHP